MKEKTIATAVAGITKVKVRMKNKNSCLEVILECIEYSYLNRPDKTERELISQLIKEKHG